VPIKITCLAKKGIYQPFKLSSVKKLTIKMYADWPNLLALSNLHADASTFLVKFLQLNHKARQNVVNLANN
jgi:hypothetical protein